MLTVAYILSAGLSLHLIYTIFESWIGFRSIQDLTTQTTLDTSQLPSVSIIFSALNEEDNLTAALITMLQLDYPQLEIIAINDRSSDKTGAILDSFAKVFSKLRVIHIATLPENWLGKNHALYLGAKCAKGDWLLFTDADVIMDPALLTKTMSYAITHKIDHLTIYEKHVLKSFWLKILSFGSYITYCFNMKPWRIRYPWSKKYLGHGAFNLVKAKAYRQCGGHRVIAMNCLDDLELGRLLKKHNFKQATVKGRSYIEREWYSSLNSMIQGLSKNSFAYFDFKLQSVVRDFSLAIFYYFWPFMAIFLFRDQLFWINVFNILLMLFFTILVASQFGISKRLALFYPVGIVLLMYTVCNSIYLTFKYKGIYWRNTHYVLQKLRSKPVPIELLDNKR